VLEAYGWKRLKSKISKDYFYDSDNLRVVQQDESFSYYNYNKKIKTYEKTVYNGSQPEKLKTSYFYTNLNSHNNIGNIEQIVTERDGMVISTQKLVYNGITLKPEIMQASKGTNLVENKIQFVRRDSYGNLQEVKKEDGRSTVYIWGYNKSLPIAMIEGATYNDVIAAASIPISDAITASNDNALTDGILLPKLNAVREALGAYHVTTYTHLPLAGIATVTDVNGKRTSFEYDNQKRLVSVKDNDGNILSENKYFNLGQYNIETLYE
jgi:YD repeat-containing protein